MAIKIKNSRKKVRVNITVDKTNLEKAQKKLKLFGGKVSTLFNAYLNDFVKSSGERPEKNQEELNQKVKDLEKRLKNLEQKK